MQALESQGRPGMLYPLLVTAAVFVIIFSGLGIAALTGLLPQAQSGAGEETRIEPRAEALEMPERPRVTRAHKGAAAPAAGSCVGCGTITSVTPYPSGSAATGLGAVAGGVVGGVLGNQIGRGNGRAVATIAGAAGGAYVGNELEKRSNGQIRYRVGVLMDDGSRRDVHLASADWRSGDRVRISDGKLLSLR